MSVVRPRPRPLIRAATLAAVLLPAIPIARAEAASGLAARREAPYPPIATIRIEREDIFDLDNPDERHLPYIWADRLHIETRESVIRRELLFEEGDLADPDVLYESERNLRHLNFLHDNSRIETLPRDDGRVDVVVHVRDIWTTRPSASIQREGNETTGRFSFVEDNLLGAGKRVGVTVRKDLDRHSGGVEYHDPRLLGSRWTLDGAYFDRSDGLLYLAGVDRPFYSLLTERAGGGSGTHFSQITTLQVDGDDAPGFRQRHTDVDLRFGQALSTGYERVRRLIGHLQLQDDTFGVEPGENPLSTRPPVGGAGYVALPEDRRFRIVGAEYRSTDVRYVRISYLDRFDRFEDINLGNEWSTFLGVSPEALGDSHNRLHFSSRLTRWLRPSLSTCTRLEGYSSGRYLAGSGENVISGIDLRHYYLGWPRQTLVFHLDHSWGHNLDGDRQFVLGSESGLRGYDNRRFDGNKRLLTNIEDRAYLVFDWFHLISVAFTGFADAGYVWRAGENEDLGDLASDIGIGFRFDVTRGSGGTVIRLDYAYPLNGFGREESPRGILSFTAGQAF